MQPKYDAQRKSDCDIQCERNKNHRECDLNSLGHCVIIAGEQFLKSTERRQQENPQTAIIWAMNVCIWLASWHKNSHQILFNIIRFSVASHSHQVRTVPLTTCAFYESKHRQKHTNFAKWQQFLCINTWIQDISIEKGEEKKNNNNKKPTKTTELSSKHMRYFKILW